MRGVVMRCAMMAVTLAAAAPAHPAPPAVAAPPAVTVSLRHGAPGAREMTFGGIRPTTWASLEDGGEAVLLATAERAASLRWAPVALAAVARPLLRWRWRVDALPARGDLRARRTDDAGARVYVGFRYSPEMVPIGQRIAYWAARRRHGEYPPYAGVAYVWAAAPAAGTVLIHPEYPRLLEVVVRAGGDGLGAWHDEERDPVADYVAAFGTQPPPLSHVAVMSDADDTRDRAAARFSDLVLAPR
jgi:hypothetical protein